MCIKGPRARVLWLRRPHRHPLSCCSRDGRSLRYVPTCRFSLRTLAAHVCTVRQREQPANRTVGGRLWDCYCRDHTDSPGGRRVGWLS